MKSIQASNNNSINTLLGKAGPLIKAARESKSLSSEQLANSLRIGEEQLLAIENCQETSLPESVFIKAMIRRISEKLDIDIDIESLNESSNNEMNSKSSTKEKTSQRRTVRAYVNTTNIILIAIFSLCLGVLWPKVVTDYLEKPKRSNDKISKLLKPFANTHINQKSRSLELRLLNYFQ